MSLAAVLGGLSIFSNSDPWLWCGGRDFLNGRVFCCLCMGVLGEYLGRVYDEVRSRPLSIINKVYYASQLNPGQISIDRQEGDGERVFRVA